MIQVIDFLATTQSGKSICKLERISAFSLRNFEGVEDSSDISSTEKFRCMGKSQSSVNFDSNDILHIVGFSTIL